MTKIAKKDFTTRTRRVRAGAEVTAEMLADAAMSAEELEAKGFIGESEPAAPPHQPSPAGLRPAGPSEEGEDGTAKAQKRR